MCYAIPGKIVEIKNKIAVVDYFGERRNVLREFVNVQNGDYVYAQGGIIVDKISAAEAVEILKLWKDEFFALKRVDQKLARMKTAPGASNVLRILQKANLRQKFSRVDLRKLLELKEKSALKLLYQTANNTRQRENDNACCVHGIIEFSNHCRNNCLYCGIRRNRKIKRYRMSIDEIVETAKYAVRELGFKALVLQSGEDYWYDDEKLGAIVSAIRKLNVLIFLSIGMRSKKIYQKLYQAGARAVLMRFETADKRSFEKLRPETDFSERVRTIKFCKKIGYLVASGFLIGLSGETVEDRINNIQCAVSLRPDMYSVGPFIPAPGTPLAIERKVGVDEALKTIAVLRLVDRNSKILVTTALETLGSEAKRQGLRAGANSIMLNVTPARYQKLYALYPGRPAVNSVKKNISETVKLLHSLGRAPTDLGL